MRALAAHGVFMMSDDHRFAHTSESLLLRRDHPTGLRHVVLMHGDIWQWHSWQHLTAGIRSGQSPFLSAFGKDVHAYFAEDDPESRAVHAQALTEIARATDGPVVAALDLSRARTVVHVGGRSPAFLASLVERNPHIEAVLFGEHVWRVSNAVGPSDRIRFQPGDPVQAVDCKADVYVLKQLLHFHDDSTSVRILGNCASQAPSGARIIVNERVIDGPEPAAAAMHDVMMFVVFGEGGSDRTAGEFADLFERAGLRWSGLTSTPSGMCLIEAVKV